MLENQNVFLTFLYIDMQEEYSSQEFVIEW